MSSKQTVAVLGAGGTIGFGMARNLARAGFVVRAWNRSAKKAAPLEAEGAVLVTSAREAVRGADVVLTILFDTDATLAVMDGDDGALAELDPSTVWLQMATLGARGTEACAALASARGVAFVDAPVAGTKTPAMEGTLTILASGQDVDRSRVDPVLEVVGARTLWVGAAGAGTELKLVVNAWLASVVEGIAESLALAEGIGLDPQLLLDAVAGGPLDSGYLRMKGKSMIDRDFAPQFALAGGTKDTELLVELAESRGLDLPVLRAVRDRWIEGRREHGDLDISATFLTSAPPESR